LSPTLKFEVGYLIATTNRSVLNNEIAFAIIVKQPTLITLKLKKLFTDTTNKLNSKLVDYNSVGDTEVKISLKDDRVNYFLDAKKVKLLIR